MKKLIAIFTICLFTAPAFAGHGHHNGRYAKVISVTPVYHQASHHQCYSNKGHYRSKAHIAPAVAGSVIGGTLGHSVSKDPAGAIIGAIIGGVVAHEIVGPKSLKVHHPSPRRCHWQKHRKSLAGYDVVYRYRGDLFHTFTDEHPGHHIKVTRQRTFHH